jgi:hypothetical protein
LPSIDIVLGTAITTGAGAGVGRWVGGGFLEEGDAVVGFLLGDFVGDFVGDFEGESLGLVEGVPTT